MQQVRHVQYVQPNLRGSVEFPSKQAYLDEEIRGLENLDFSYSVFLSLGGWLLFLFPFLVFRDLLPF